MAEWTKIYADKNGIYKYPLKYGPSCLAIITLIAFLLFIAGLVGIRRELESI